MAFGKVTKEDLIAMGLDPDKAVKKEDLDTFKQGIVTDTNTSIKNELAALEQKLTDAIAAVKPNPAASNNDNNNNNNQNPNPNQNQSAQVDAMTFMEDPMKYVREENAKVVGALLAQQMQMAADMAYETLSTTLPGFKNEALKKEIDDEWARYKIKQNPRELLKNLHDLVIGRHAQEIQEDTAKKNGKYNLVHSGATSRTALQNTTGANPPTAAEQLTAQELAAAKNFGMTPEEYIAQKGTLRYA